MPEPVMPKGIPNVNIEVPPGIDLARLRAALDASEWPARAVMPGKGHLKLTPAGPADKATRAALRAFVAGFVAGEGH